jgi:hypothetical protein
MDWPVGRSSPLPLRGRAGERGSYKAPLPDSYPLILAFSRREKEDFF